MVVAVVVNLSDIRSGGFIGGVERLVRLMGEWTDEIQRVTVAQRLFFSGSFTTSDVLVVIAATGVYDRSRKTKK